MLGSSSVLPAGVTAQIPPLQGTMMKKGGVFGRTWQQRYFYLDPEAMELRYYHNEVCIIISIVVSIVCIVNALQTTVCAPVSVAAVLSRLWRHVRQAGAWIIPPVIECLHPPESSHFSQNLLIG